MRAERATTLAASRKQAGVLWSGIDRVLGDRIQDRAELGSATGALIAFVNGAPIVDDEAAFIGYRLLLAVPFPAARALEHGFYVAAQLGDAFARGDARRLRRTCNEWVEWSERRLDATLADGRRRCCARRSSPPRPDLAVGLPRAQCPLGLARAAP